MNEPKQALAKTPLHARKRIAALLVVALAIVLLLTGLTSNDANAQAPGRLIIETVFDSTVSVPAPGAINYEVLQPPTTFTEPVAQTPNRVEYELTGAALFYPVAEPADLAWVFTQFACSRDGVDEDAIQPNNRISEQSIAQFVTVGAAEELACTATFGWDPPATTLTIVAEVVGQADLSGSLAPVLFLLDGTRSGQVDLDGQTQISWPTDQAEMGLITPPQDWTLLDGDCDGANELIELAPGEGIWSQAEYLMLFADDSPTCTFRFEAPPVRTMTVTNVASDAGLTSFSMRQTGPELGFVELQDGESLTTNITFFGEDPLLFIESIPPEPWGVESADCGNELTTTITPSVFDGESEFFIRVTAPPGFTGDINCVVTHVEIPTSPAAFVELGTATWRETGHHLTFDANNAGEGALAAVKADGRLFVRRMAASADVTSPGSFGPWMRLGAADWSSVDLAVGATGSIELVAVKTDGRLFSRIWRTDDTFGPWIPHGRPTWDPSTQPSISVNGPYVTIAAIKADGRLYTRRWSVSDSWSPFVAHGRAGWTHVDLAANSYNDVSFVATKQDGRLYTRNRLNSTWKPFVQHGNPNWDPSIPVSISADYDISVFAAVKEDGRMFTREFAGPGVVDFVRHGPATSWSAVSVHMREGGSIALAGVQRDGQLSTTARPGIGEWDDLIDHGAPTWSTESSPAAIFTPQGSQFLAVKADGRLFTRLVR